MKTLLWVSVVFCLAGPAAQASERQQLGDIKDAVRTFLARETMGLPGDVELVVGEVDDRVALPVCTQMQAFASPGARFWGRATVGVRCVAPAAWTIYIPVEIKVTGTYLVAAHPLTAGQPFGAEDVITRSGELTRLPAGVVVDPSQLTGKVPAFGVAGGEPLRQDMLRAPVTVQSNQPVKLVSRGHGFVVTAEGWALSNAGDGQTIQVRTPSGQIVAGIVRPGPQVELTF